MFDITANRIVVRFSCNSIDCKNHEVSGEEHDVGEWECSLDAFLGSPGLVPFRSLRHHVNEGHAEEDAR